MKIESTGEWLGRVQDPRKATGGPSGAAGFDDVLKKTLGQAAGADAVPASGAPESGAVQRVEDFIDLLDGYREKLADPQVGLKRLELSLKRVEEGRRELETLMEKLPESDRLRDIVNRSLVTASMEIFRFRRGDYLAA
jgi:hypothetical protein